MPLRINTNAESIQGQVQIQAQGQIQTTVNVAGTAGNAALEELLLLKLVELACTQRELARARAKYGVESQRAEEVLHQSEQLQETVVVVAAEQERFVSQQATQELAVAEEDVYRYQGRVVDEQGLGVAGRVVQAQSADGTTLVATTTDEHGNFTLELELADEAATEAEIAAAANPTSGAAGKVLREEVAAGNVTFDVAVEDASGRIVTEGATRVPAGGSVDTGELALAQAGAERAAFEFDPRVRYSGLAPRTIG